MKAIPKKSNKQKEKDKNKKTAVLQPTVLEVSKNKRHQNIPGVD